MTGGATDSPQIMRRVAAIWRRPVVTIGRVGAALGSAVAGVSALRKDGGGGPELDELRARLLPGAQYSTADLRSRWQAKLGLRLSF